MEPANHNSDPGSPEPHRDIRGARELIGLHAHQADKRFGPGFLIFPDDLLIGNPLDRIVDEGCLPLQVLAQDPPFADIFAKTVQARECIAREHPFPIADHIAFVIIFGGLDQKKTEAFVLMRTRLSRLYPLGLRDGLGNTNAVRGNGIFSDLHGGEL